MCIGIKQIDIDVLLQQTKPYVQLSDEEIKELDPVEVVSMFTLRAHAEAVKICDMMKAGGRTSCTRCMIQICPNRQFNYNPMLNSAK